ncbi:fimbrial biogenesis chaperone [Mesorhizobium amorphae]|uniref:fimbrial biogenesis chaperone n=1 Tax=Mesorhizobium amorphae TaxID=71433 RepID=UPI00177B98C3|nr:molecular chaperone [Mesorhizobium amorphae]
MRLIIASTFAVLAAAWSAAEAASLRVAPVGLELVAPSAAATLSLSNEEKRPVNVQIRVFRWSQVNGAERLEPTSDVVASPPATVLKGESKLLVRIARVSKRPVSKEESYRVLIDQLPDPSRRGTTSVALVMRYSIPVFFSPPDQAPPALSWSIRRNGGNLEVTASNSGGRRIRLSDLSLRSGSGKPTLLGKGLVGYVLAGSVKTWSFNFGRVGRTVAVEATSDVGQIDANASVR